MKKKLVTGLLMCAMVCSMLTGCGETKSASDNTPVTEAGTQQTVEATEPMTEETESVETESAETESTETETTETETTETEAVEGDFLSQNGITITECGDALVQMAVGDPNDGTLTDDVETAEIVANIYRSDVDGNLVKEIFEATYKPVGHPWSITNHAFDRYTGKSYFSGYNQDADGYSTAVVEYQGNEYECKIKTEMVSNEDGTFTARCTVIHPADYDGVVFGLGACTKTQYDFVFDYSSEFTIADYANIYMDGHTFFTWSNK